MDIEWYAVCGYKGFYEWSPTLERVRSVARMGTKGIVLKWFYNSDGRPYVILSKNGVTRHFYKYMFIYSHFHQVEIPLGFDVHHIDFNEDNNGPSNLKLLTEEEHKKLHAKTKEICQKNNTLTSKPVVAVDEHNNVVHRFESISEAGRNGFKQSAVSCACRGCFHREGNHKYKGLYLWYEDEWLAMQK